MKCECLFSEHPCGARYRRSRCRFHRKKFPSTNVFTEESYKSFGVFSDCSSHVREFTEGFGSLVHSQGACLEVGCGVSPYVGIVKQAGMSYEGCDSSPFACRWMRDSHQVKVHQGMFEDITFRNRYDMIIAAHVLEHMRNAESALKKMSQLLNSNGVLYLLIPDDSDLYNQDHNWFFSKDSAVRLLESVGFSVESAVVKKIVKRESFMYFVSRRNS